MKLSLILCAVFLPNVCFLQTTDGQLSKALSNDFGFPKDRKGIPTGRIIGGVEVSPHTYPFQAGLYIFSSASSTIFCGGSLITSSWVLTAAHCLVDHVSYIFVILGAHNISDYEPSQVVLTSTKFYYHQGYNSVTYVNDVGLVKLPRPVTLGYYISTVALASGNNTYANVTGTIVGWGRTSDLSGASDILREVNTTILTNKECAAAGGQFQEIINPSHVCVSGKGTVGSCNGDSGGPLLVNGVQIGIVSFGSRSCLLGTPSVFTRVTFAYDWIMDTIRRNSSYKNVACPLTMFLIFFISSFVQQNMTI